jgi:hypothetical protein
VVKIGTNFTPYVAFTESGVPKVKKRLTDGTWEQVGANLATSASYTKIYSNSIGELFVAYIDLSAGSKLAVKKYDYVTGTWNALNEDNTNLYVSTGNANGMSAVSSYSSTHRCSIAFDSFNTPYIAFSEAGMLPYVKKFNGTTWETVGSGAVPGGFGAAVGLAIDANDKPWLVYLNLAATNSSTGTVALYGYNGTAWTAVTNPTPITGARHTNIAIKDANTLCIAYFNTGNTNRATAILYNKSTNTWGSATTLANRDSPNLSLINDNAGNVYCSFIDYTASTNVFPTRVRFLAAGSTTWTELKDPTVLRGIDEPTGSPSIAIGNAPYPYVVYTKTNSSSVTTPIVRMYTPPPPPAELTTNNITNISTTTAIAGGNITSDGGVAITQRGVVYSNSNSSPTTADAKVVATTTGSGSFSVTLTGLTPATFYYARAYAINSAGTSYGNTVRLSSLPVADAVVTTPKQVEFLTRGLVAIQKTSSSVFLSWRLLGNDPSSIAFNVYRNGVKVNATPITTTTNYTDATTTPNNNYSITTIINGVESEQTSPTPVWALNTFNSARNNKLSIPIQMPAGGTLPDGQSYTYTANDASVGDVDGDGTYEIILKWDPTAVNDNAGGYSGKQIFDCYRLDGTKLWRIDLGINVNAGPHYNQFMVYDFDGDGKAEMILKTADGTVDGAGTVIGNAAVDYRNSAGWVQQGPEFLTVFNGLTGAAMATINYQPARDNTADWGDTYGNRQDRFVSAVAYLDGARPSIIVGRGYYNRLTRAAYNWRNGQLTMLWKFDSKDPTHPEYNSYSGQGNHQMTIGDVDGDGKDEIINGSSAINDDGKPLWTYGMGHGDALHMTDMDLDRPGQEIWINLESPGSYDGLGLRQYDAKTGQTNWGIATTGDVGRSMAADIDPYFKGYEMWGSSGDNTYDVKGNPISTNKPSYNFGIWWDGDLGRELLDGNVMDKWNPTTKSQGRLFTIYQAYPVSSNNSTKKNPCLQADILGDWREEMILRKSDNTELVIFTTDTPTTYRIPTLMHDPQYRTAIAWQNSAYNQPPNTSYYIGYDMDVNNIPTAKIAVVDVVAPKVTAINRLTPTSEKNNATTVTYRVTFSENVSGVDVADFALNTTGNVAGTIASVSPVTNASFDVTVNNISSDGTLRLDVKNGGTGIIDGANNALAEGFTNGEIYTFDHTNPTLTIATISSSNAKPIFAKEADTVTLNFEASESITNLEATIAGHAVTPTNLGSNKYSATYQLTNTDTEGTIPFTIQFKDEVGNVGIPVSTTTDSKTVTFDHTVPTLPSVLLSSNNINSAYAKEGDVVSLNFTASEVIETPTVTIAEHAITTTDLGSNKYSATYQLTNTDTEGTIPFTIEFKDIVGNKGIPVSATTDTKTVTFDHTAPTLSSVLLSSNNINSAYAKEGDVISLNFTASEAIETPSVAIAGHAVTITDLGSNNYNATYQLTNTDTEGTIPFTIEFKDIVGNTATTVSTSTDAKTVTFDRTVPTLSSVLLSSNNINSAYAKEGNIISLNFTASEAIETPAVTIAGHAVTITDLGSNKYSATYQLTNTDTEGTIPFSIQFKDEVGNTGIPVSATTDAKTIVFDRTVPTLPSVQLSSNNINSAYAKEGNIIALNFTASETIETPTVTIAGHAVTSTNLGNNKYSATYQLTNTDTEGSVGFTIDFADPAGNIGSKVTTAANSITYDRTNPSITAPADLNISSNNGSCEATNVLLGTASTSDTNPIVTTNNAPSIFPVGTTTVTWTTKDAAGNSNTATQKVTVIDSQKPLITNPSSQSFCYNGNTYTIPTLSATDNCGIASISYTISGATSRSGNGNNASGNFNVGVSTITWTVSDIHNNQSMVSNTVTVNAAVSVTINDIYAVNQATDNKNTLYIGYGPSSLKLTAKPNGGSGSFGFKWNTGETTPFINVNTAGTYNVIITDAQGCTTTTSTAINVIDVSCGNNKDKVMICHNGASICVASSAVQAHLNHGDNIGACGTYSKVAKSPILETSSSVEPGLSVYPNPTSGSFSIQINSLTSGKATINIVTINGQIVEQRDVVLTEGIQSFSFNISGKASGVYLIKVSGIEGVNTQNLILQN